MKHEDKTHFCPQLLQNAGLTDSLNHDIHVLGIYFSSRFRALVKVVEDQPRFQLGGGKDLLLVVEEPWAARDVWAGAQSAVGGTR